MYDKYKRARDAAWRVLIKYKIIDFPVDVISLALRLNVKVKTFGEAGELLKLIGADNQKDAFTYVTSLGEVYVLYNENVYIHRVRFSVAHELGHILLKTVNRVDSFAESEANIFARDLLMPAIICKHHCLTDAASISKFFNVSAQAAEIRSERIKELIERDKWLTHPLEREYYSLYTKNGK